jgi:hypothetical protein
MRALPAFIMGLLAFIVADAALPGQQAPKKTPREALHPFNDIVGDWRGTATPAGTKQEQQDGFWIEQISCGWRFEGENAWIKLRITKGKHLETAELRYVPDKDHFELKAETVKKESLTFTGTLKGNVLTLERTDEKTKEAQRIVITMLHPGERFLYRYDVKPQGKALFAMRYKVGALREGIEFAKGSGHPECIVSGGLGTMQVTYKGQTYYVCCSGCRTEFNANPERYIKEYQEKLAKKKK